MNPFGRVITWCLLLLISATAIAEEQAKRIVVFGDSTTAKFDDTKIYAELLAEDLPKQGLDVEIINAGKPNDDTRGARQRFEQDVLSANPDVVVIQFGINDAAVDVFKKKNPATQPRVLLPQYAENLTYFVKTLKQRKIPVILMTSNKLCWNDRLRAKFGKPPYNVNDPDGLNAFLRQYVAAVRTIAKKAKTPLVDVYAAYEATSKKRKQSHEQFLSDGVHPNNEGHRLLADLLEPELVKVLGKN